MDTLRGWGKSSTRLMCVPGPNVLPLRPSESWHKDETTVNRKTGLEIGRRNLLMTTAASILAKWGAADARAATMTGNVILLGDSILDNAAYVSRGADVVAHLKRRLPT